MIPRADLLQPVNNFVCYLVGDISALQTTIAITTKIVGLSTLPSKGIISIDDEVVSYDGINSSGAAPVLLNCGRGQDNTLPRPHASGSAVEVRWVAAHHNVLADLLFAIQSALGDDFLNSEAQWGPLAPAYTTLAQKLNLTGPEIIPQTGTSWSAVHNRTRPVAVQLWQADADDPNVFHSFQAQISQSIDSSGATPSTVTVETFAEVRSGFIVIQ